MSAGVVAHCLLQLLQFKLLGNYLMGESHLPRLGVELVIPMVNPACVGTTTISEAENAFGWSVWQ